MISIDYSCFSLTLHGFRLVVFDFHRLASVFVVVLCFLSFLMVSLVFIDSPWFSLGSCGFIWLSCVLICVFHHFPLIFRGFLRFSRNSLAFRCPLRFSLVFKTWLWSSLFSIVFFGCTLFSLGVHGFFCFLLVSLAFSVLLNASHCLISIGFFFFLVVALAFQMF